MKTIPFLWIFVFAIHDSPVLFQRQQVTEDPVVGDVRRPTVRGGHSGVKGRVRVGKPLRADVLRLERHASAQRGDGRDGRDGAVVHQVVERRVEDRRDVEAVLLARRRRAEAAADAGPYEADPRRDLAVRFVRARSRCEWCGAKDGELDPATGSRVVLTTAHIYDRNPMACSLLNLAALTPAMPPGS